MIASATQVKAKGLCGYCRLFLRLRKVKQQLAATPGLIVVDYRGLRALTMWKDLEAMRTFRNTGAHRNAMADAWRVGYAKSVTWEVMEMPRWEDVIARLDSVQFNAYAEPD